MSKSMSKSPKTVNVELTKTEDEYLQELQQEFCKKTGSIHANKGSVIKHYLASGNKEMLARLALCDYTQTTTWELINLSLDTLESSSNYLVDEDENTAIGVLDSLTDSLIKQLPKIPLDRCFIHSDKLISNDMTVALDGVYEVGKVINTKVGRIKFNHGIGNIVIPLPESNEAILIGVMSNLIADNLTCFTPSNQTIDRELTSDRHNIKTTNMYKKAKQIAIATWCHETNFMRQVKKAKQAQVERNARSDYYQQSLRLRG